jgi:cell division protein FtsX
MVYLAPGTSEAQRLDTRYRLQTIAGIQSIRFISKDDALVDEKADAAADLVAGQPAGKSPARRL